MKFIKKEGSVNRSFLAKCSKQFDITPQIMEQIILRGNNTIEKISEFLKPSMKSLRNPFNLSGMHELIERIKAAKEKNEKVLIFGDYDVDGISATAIMLKALKKFDINADYYLPNRYIDGYGLTNSVIDKIKEKFNPELIITVDCGISCYAEIDYAKTKGIEILVTDHHEIPDVLPKTIIVNAKLPNQNYGFDGLCGTGVAFKVAQALLGKAAEEFLPIACLATIADIVPLVDENRAIVHFGLKKFDMLPVGVKLLFKKLGVNVNKCTASDISYKIAPKLNASGRMGSADDSLKLFITDDTANLYQDVNTILTHNNNRRELCDIVEKDCRDILSKLNLVAPSIILASPSWDQGILGIICAKLSNEYNRPVFLFSEKGDEMCGSVRSIPGINIHVLLSDMQDILETFGGHPVAAGLTLKSKNFNEFINRVNQYLSTNYDQSIFLPKNYYDIEVQPQDLTPKFMKDLALLEPCGCENELPKLYMKAEKYEVIPMRNFYQYCNIKIGNNLNLVHFNCDHEYQKYNNASKLDIIFEMQMDSINSKTLRGVVKCIGCQPIDVKEISKLPTIPYLEHLKYVNTTVPANFKVVPLKKEFFEITENFGTAIVINTDIGFRRCQSLIKLDKISRIDVCNGIENSGLNALILAPQSIEFAKFYKKIYFLDAVVDKSYIAEINRVSDAEIFVAKDSVNNMFFETLNLNHQGLGIIYKDLLSTKISFANYLELYFYLKNRKKIHYSYKELYAGVMIFEELKLLTIEKEKGKKVLRFNRKIKTDLNNSLLFRTIQNLKNKKINKKNIFN